MGKLKDPFGHTWTIATQIELRDDEKKPCRAAPLRISNGIRTTL